MAKVTTNIKCPCDHKIKVTYIKPAWLSFCGRVVTCTNCGAELRIKFFRHQSLNPGQIRYEMQLQKPTRKLHEIMEAKRKLEEAFRFNEREPKNVG